VLKLAGYCNEGMLMEGYWNKRYLADCQALLPSTPEMRAAAVQETLIFGSALKALSRK
jgi:hypothetical protein